MAFNYNEIISKIHKGWLPFFKSNKIEFQNILNQLNENSEFTIYPKSKNILRALFYFPPEEIKLSIHGQDPYIAEENNSPQATGLSFSVPKKHKKIPPSLKNIFKELKQCYPDFVIPSHGSLKRWARQEKILLLNSALTVYKGKSNSHAKLWSNMTDNLIKYISEKNPSCIFLLMGWLLVDKKLIFLYMYN